MGEQSKQAQFGTAAKRPASRGFAGFRVRVGLTAVAACAMLASLTCGCKKTPNPDVWATVNGQPIMKSEVEKYYNNKVSTMQQQPTTDESAMLKLDILHSRINEEVIRQRAEKMHLVATDAEVDAKLAQLKAPYTP